MKNIKKSKSAGLEIESSNRLIFFLYYTLVKMIKIVLYPTTEKKKSYSPFFLFQLQNYFSILTYRLSSWKDLKVAYFHTHEESMKVQHYQENINWYSIDITDSTFVPYVHLSK